MHASGISEERKEQCRKCALKHLADAKIELRELMNGWWGTTHEMDATGNLSQAEKHLLMIEPQFAALIRTVRVSVFEERRKVEPWHLGMIESVWFELSQKAIAEGDIAEARQDEEAKALPAAAAVPPMLPAGTFVDVVIPYEGKSRNGDFELRMALRSIERNFKPLGKVYIVSAELPQGLQGAVHVPAPDAHRHNKDANIIDKLRAACALPELSSVFMFWSDDQMLVAPLAVEEIAPVCHGYVIEGVLGDGPWQRRLKATAEFLRLKGIEKPLHWDSHVPQPIDKAAFLRLTDGVDYQSEPGYCVNTLYFGLKGEDPHVYQHQVKHTQETAKSCCGGVARKLEQKTWLGYNDEGLTILKRWMLDSFPEASRFESAGIEEKALPAASKASPVVADVERPFELLERKAEVLAALPELAPLYDDVERLKAENPFWRPANLKRFAAPLNAAFAKLSAERGFSLRG